MTKPNKELKSALELLAGVVLIIIQTFINTKFMPQLMNFIILSILTTILLVYLNKEGYANIKDLFKWENLKYVLLIYILSKAAAYAVNGMVEIMGITPIAEDYFLENQLRTLTGVKLGLALFDICFIIPIIVNFVFRHVALKNIGNMKKSAIPIAAVVIVLLNGISGIPEMLIIFAINIIPLIVYYKTERIDICIAATMLNNIVASILILS